MTATNPHPLANPFNTRLGPSNYSLDPRGQSYIGNAFNSSRKDLPDPTPAGQINFNDLHVPDTTPISRHPLADWNQLVQDYSRNHVWDDSEIYSLNSTNKSRIDQGLSRNDIEYWDMVKRESDRLLSSMSPEQQQMLANMEKSDLFKTNFIDESKRNA